MNFNQPKAAAGVSADMSVGKNTDREIWRGPDEGGGDYYADSLHITKDGALGINCGGSVYVKPIREWHRLAGGPIDGLRPAGVSKDTRMSTAKEMLELAAHHEKECNRYQNGTCMTLRCMRRGGYVAGTIPDYANATCEAHETALILRTLPSSDQCVAMEALERIAVQANYAAERLHEIDISYVSGKVAGALNGGVERLWAIATVAKAALAVPQAAVAVQDQWFVDRSLPIMAMSGDIESDRVLKLHFRRKVTDKDRADLVDVLNAALALTNPAPDAGDAPRPHDATRSA